MFPAERKVDVRRAEEEEVAGFPERMDAASEHRPGVEDDSFEGCYQKNMRTAAGLPAVRGATV